MTTMMIQQLFRNIFTSISKILDREQRKCKFFLCNKQTEWRKWRYAFWPRYEASLQEDGKLTVLTVKFSSLSRLRKVGWKWSFKFHQNCPLIRMASWMAWQTSQRNSEVLLEQFKIYGESQSPDFPPKLSRCTGQGLKLASTWRQAFRSLHSESQW